MWPTDFETVPPWIIKGAITDLHVNQLKQLVSAVKQGMYDRKIGGTDWERVETQIRQILEDA